MTSVWTLANAYESFVLAIWGAVGPSFCKHNTQLTAQPWVAGVFIPRGKHLVYPAMLTDDGQSAVILDMYSHAEVYMEGRNVIVISDVFNPVNPDERQDFWFAYQPEQLSDALLSQIRLMYPCN